MREKSERKKRGRKGGKKRRRSAYKREIEGRGVTAEGRGCVNR